MKLVYIAGLDHRGSTLMEHWFSEQRTMQFGIPTGNTPAGYNFALYVRDNSRPREPDVEFPPPPRPSFFLLGEGLPNSRASSIEGLPRDNRQASLP